ncbi:MAG: ribonuclease E [Thalassospira sp.]|uniref:ribonuclease E/G n=1 Tax=unclassified Thalassospira TaxID=2648997 RepID=UPI000C4323EE|nr:MULTISPECIES: ribonuclease E/G [unclassified Thalassospira]MBE70440.1 ribonuclease E [Thalassospira sp.]QPO10878.1 ribonuclease E/G [Thalassospira sp. A40-3]|tara:strand:+ start:679 stop:2088 length:1410 start_codon:yes stop_codon:yes gene_type:complete
MAVGGIHNSRLLIDAVALERRVALIENDRLTRLWIDRGGPARFDIHLGRISKMMPEMAAAMVALDGLPDGLLPFDRYNGPLHEGQWVLVQISRLGFDDKGVKLTGRIAIEGVGMILRPGANHIELPRKLKDGDRRTELHELLSSLQAGQDGIMLRSVALDWTRDAITAEYKLLKSQLQKAEKALSEASKPQLVSEAQSETDQVIERHLMAGGQCVVDGTNEFVRLRGLLTMLGKSDDNLARHAGSRLLFNDQDIEDEIAAALAPRVELQGGGWIAIDPATALCAIDVNAAGADAGRDSETRAVEVNLRAAAEIVHQIRLRNIGGLVVIDPLRMKSRAGRDKFDAAIRDAFGSELDGAVQIGGFTRLGLYEFSRQRAGESLRATLFAKQEHTPLLRDAALNAVVRAVVAESRNGVTGMVNLSVNPGVAKALADQADAIQILTNAFGGAPQIVADPTLEDDAYRLEKNHHE